ncbi:MAG: type II toxin-antitoxin system HicB family antitoxin [Christensenellales bacterium]|nr:type II toxin-antitoxin system HicB family antitoxin [Christensenellales bacterium]
MNRLEYKGYWAKIEYSAKDKVLYGKIEGIADLVNFESADANSIEHEFHLAVDDYLEFCRELGKDPERAYKGSFNVRITPDLHKKLAISAAKQGISLNDTVEQAIQYYLGSIKASEFSHKFLESVDNVWDNRSVFSTVYQSGEPSYSFGNEVRILISQEQ